ncbi:heparan-alpha-glucosaminide N-acetyltransferase [Marinomonas ostreistagni]|uniref:DUF1624 domain-containing protein n=1 Tax=Marinomonas ostreistagni TaxID=359209 RepID=A0ABS0ZAH1_9GAMM|nr:heparan-alpha-glucosaminide N-acetyltransferase [Marinomonas ostreistagni]MBJ7550663.1 DUF1624 domain-containing protein [Marinomonas ostreistagni]
MPAIPSNRSNILDAYRGTAVLLMIAFHFLWDLREFSALSFDVNNPLWQGFRSIILFMFTSALGCASFLAVSHNHSTYRFIKNQVKLALAALILSIGTLTATPSQWIFFGILHFLFVAGWLIRPAASYPILLACAGVSLIAISAFFHIDAITAHRWFINTFNAPANTLDFINPVPWLGVAMIGPIFGYLNLHRIKLPSNTLSYSLCWLGRNALLVYLLHQLILFPTAALISLLVAQP